MTEAHKKAIRAGIKRAARKPKPRVTGMLKRLIAERDKLDEVIRFLERRI
jgi:hypothetical protein